MQSYHALDAQILELESSGIFWLFISPLISVCTLGLIPGPPGVVVMTSYGSSMADDVIFHIYFISVNSIHKHINKILSLTQHLIFKLIQYLRVTAYYGSV